MTLDLRSLTLLSLLCALAGGCTPPKGGTATDSESTSEGTTTATTGESDATSASASSTSTASSDTATSTATATDPTTTTASGTATDPGTDSDTATSSTTDECRGGCNPAPLCGEPCICCCRCSEGEGACGEVDDQIVLLQCTADGCFDAKPCEEGEACVDEGGAAKCSATLGSCEDLEAAYDEAVHAPEAVACTEAAECKVISGHCGVGLGGCYYAVHQSFDPAPLDDLATQYVELQCTSGVCDCAEPPPVDCVDQVCVLQG